MLLKIFIFAFYTQFPVLSIFIKDKKNTNFKFFLIHIDNSHDFHHMNQGIFEILKKNKEEFLFLKYYSI